MNDRSYTYPITLVSDGGDVKQIKDADALAGARTRYRGRSGFHLFAHRPGARTLSGQPTPADLVHLEASSSIYGPSDAVTTLRRIGEQQGRSRMAQAARQANQPRNGTAPAASNTVQRIVNGRSGGAA
jgi:hypothetical protein